MSLQGANAPPGPDADPQKAGDKCCVSSDERIAEKLDRLSSGLAHINERWKNRLVRKNIVFWEDYLKGDFSMVLIFERTLGPHETGDALERAIAYFNRTASGANDDVFDPANARCGNEQVVLIDLVQLGDGPKKVVATGLTARFDFLQNKTLNIGEGPLYQRLADCVFEVFPGFMEGEIFVPVCLDLPEEGHPDMVQRASHVVDSVPQDQWNLSSLRAQGVEVENLGSVRIDAERKSVRLIGGQTLKNGFELVDVAIGPFNL